MVGLQGELAQAGAVPVALGELGGEVVAFRARHPPGLRGDRDPSSFTTTVGGDDLDRVVVVGDEVQHRAHEHRYGAVEVQQPADAGGGEYGDRVAQVGVGDAARGLMGDRARVASTGSGSWST